MLGNLDLDSDHQKRKRLNMKYAKDRLIKLLMDQVAQLSTMSKIELGDDVIEEIRRLKTEAIEGESIESQYLNLLRDILENGTTKSDRTGTGTISVYGRQIRHKMKDGFPLLTTKKMYMKGVIAELLWFLKGETNIRPLVEVDCNIWNGDAFKNYVKHASANSSEYNQWMRDNGDGTLSMYTQKEFVDKIKTDEEFAKKWGDLGPIYGKQWRKWSAVKKVYGTDSLFPGAFHYDEIIVDQIRDLFRDLEKNPDSRRLMVNAWNVAEIGEMTLPPCHFGFQVYTRELSLDERRGLVTPEMHGQIYNGGDSSTLSHSEIDQWNVPTRAISLMWNQRSVDTPLGLPFNIASYALLLELLGHVHNMVPDELIGNLGDTHIYLNQVDGVEEQLKRSPLPLPKLTIYSEFWPTESGECGVGPFTKDVDLLFNEMKIEDFQIENYESHPKIHFPLSN